MVYCGPMKQDETYYKALLARDPRFDGKFFVGVKTTGIYCRPICPAKPLRKNVEFFSNATSAEKAGYRPCKRCRPESAPLSSAWVGTSAMVQRAVKMIHHPDMVNFNEDRFADIFGVSSRHLRRVFKDEIGKTPKQLFFENRLHLARKLIIETPLPMIEIASAAGFQSIRRFNEAFKKRFAQSPSQVRRNKLPELDTLKVSLQYRPPFDFQGLLGFYKTHQMGDLEWFADGKMYRVIHYDSHVGTIALSDDPEHSRIWVEVDFPDNSYLHVILAQVRNLLDLNSDPVLIANSLEKAPSLKKLLKKFPGTRLPSGWSAWEVAISTILGQLVSVSRGRALVADLIRLVGTDSGLEREGRRIHLFPTPQQIVDADLKDLKTTETRRRALKDFAKAVLEKRLSLEPVQDMDEFQKKIQSIRGIGPWTAQYIALKSLRHTDAFPATDLVLARALTSHSARSIESTRPWRGYVATLLWREQSAPKKGKA